MSADHPLVLTALGMGTVMIVLYMINLMIVLLSKVLSKKAVPAVPAAPAAPSYNQEEEETLAVIMAAVTSIVGKDKIAGINIYPRQ